MALSHSRVGQNKTRKNSYSNKSNSSNPRHKGSRGYGNKKSNSNYEGNKSNYQGSNKRDSRNNGSGYQGNKANYQGGKPSYKSNSSNYQGSKPGYKGNSSNYQGNNSSSRSGGYNSNSSYSSNSGSKRSYGVNKKKFVPRGTSGRNSRSRNKFGRGNRSKAQVIARHLYINDLQNEVAEEINNYKGVNYSKFDFNYRLDRNLAHKGFQTTTEIQEKAIPLIMEGKDVLGISATGSGKTGAFLIPMVEKMLVDKNQKLIVVAPTRELAVQIAKEAITLINGTGLNLAVIIGGESMGKQISQLKRGANIVVGTPGRLNDLINRGQLHLGGFNNIVIDEVDRMLDMGFIGDIRLIFGALAKERQTLFFSATLNKPVHRIVDSLSSSYEMIRLAENKPSKSVLQSVVDYQDNADKLDLLKDILGREDVSKAIVFVETKRYADKVDKVLYKNKFKVGVIHGNKRQNARKKVIDLFKRSKLNILVATNVAARGIDIDDISHVINFDEPQTYDEYIHRIGRTGRNGSLGTAYTFVKAR